MKFTIAIDLSSFSWRKSLAVVMEESKELKHEKKAESRALPREFLKELSCLESDEKRLDRLLCFMQEKLEARGALHFREFWEARSVALEFFKFHIHPADRVRLWARYTELCQEAKQLKELFEEESSYITEQVEQAIEAVEHEMIGFMEKAHTEPSRKEFSQSTVARSHQDQYSEVQNELTYLNAFATRVSSLRKEVVKADIRPNHRHRLLIRLRKVGDEVYPLRKEHIQRVSALFMKDVETFVQEASVEQLGVRQLLEVREEIKRLQGLAKVLTLNTEAFTRTRLQLSQCWEAVRKFLQEHKKAQHEQRETFQRNRDEISSEIERLQREFEEGKIHEKQARKSIHQIASRMRNLSLAHKDVKQLKEKLGDFEAGLEKKEERAFAPDPLCRQRGELLSRAENLLEEEESLLDSLTQLISDANGMELSHSQRVELDQKIVKVLDQIEEQSHQRECQEDLLEQIMGTSKELIETWRKIKGSSNNDFALEMAYSDLMEREKERVERVETRVAEGQA